MIEHADTVCYILKIQSGENTEYYVILTEYQKNTNTSTSGIDNSY